MPPETVEDPAAATPAVFFRVRAERCESCLYAMRYPIETRRAILGEVAERDGYVQCHSHNLGMDVCCRGFYDTRGITAGPIRLAERFHALGLGTIEQVTAEMYPRPEDEDDDE